MLPGGQADAASGRTYPVVDTGQTDCYGTGRQLRLRACPDEGDDLAGQDGAYETDPPSYTDNGDGTVSDDVTGLMWEKGFRRDVEWRDAQGIAVAADTGGHTDWRVPTIKELYSLIDFSGATGTGRSFESVPSDAVPFIDAGAFDFEYATEAGSSRRQVRYIDSQYISSTAYNGLTMNGNRTFFGVNFADGRIKGYPQRGRADGAGWYLRLVRGNPAYGKNAFRDNGDGTVADTATGLAWMQADSGGGAYRGKLGRAHYKDGRMDWPEALRFCEGLDFAGAADWRLPNAKELQSLVDYTRSPQGTHSAAIDPLFGATRITDEAGKPNYAGYWTSTTHLDGRRPGTDAAVVYFGEALGALSVGGQGQQGQPGQQGPGGGMMRPGGGRMGGPPDGPPGGMLRRPPWGGPGQGFRGDPQQAGPPRTSSNAPVIDVHGAGAQRSDPKVGDPDTYPISGQGPQGDVRRVYNYVRCVRTAE